MKSEFENFIWKIGTGKMWYWCTGAGGQWVGKVEENEDEGRGERGKRKEREKRLKWLWEKNFPARLHLSKKINHAFRKKKKKIQKKCFPFIFHFIWIWLLAVSNLGKIFKKFRQVEDNVIFEIGFFWNSIQKWIFWVVFFFFWWLKLGLSQTKKSNDFFACRDFLKKKKRTWIRF